MNRISVVINSKDPNPQWLKQCLDSAHPFDEIVLYVDGMPAQDGFSDETAGVKFVSDGKSRNISDGFNYAIAQATGNWICSFCDDDYFYRDNLLMLLDLLRANAYSDCDIIHFPVMVNGGYQWGHFNDFSLGDIETNNCIPHGSFIKREAFNRLGGYKLDEGADWNLWIRAKRAGLRFRGFKNPVYFFRHGHERSAFQKQVDALGGHEQLKRKVLINA